MIFVLENAFSFFFFMAKNVAFLVQCEFVKLFLLDTVVSFSNCGDAFSLKVLYQGVRKHNILWIFLASHFVFDHFLCVE